MKVVRRIAICLLLGGVTTVAVAWSCVCAFAQWDANHLEDDAARTRLSIYDPATYQWPPKDPWPDLVPAGWVVEPRSQAEVRSPGRRIRRLAVQSGEQPVRSFICIDAGWPLAALASRAEHSDWRPIYTLGQSPWTLKWSVGLTLPAGFEARPFNKSVYTLPVRPTAGFLLDTTFFAAAWWLLLFSFLSMSRALRRRRGLCPKCAYDLRGLEAGAMCPECGAGARR